MVWLIIWVVVLAVLCALFKKAKISYWPFWAVVCSVMVVAGGRLALLVFWGTVAMLFKIAIGLAILAVIVFGVRAVLKLGS